MNENKLITVLTPTYNRANLLPNLYNSLIAQEENNFNWLIIDDGSTDGTKNIVSGFKNDDFPVFYYRKDNGGKHTAINFAMQHIDTPLVIIVDSDDLLLPSATRIIREYAHKYEDKIKELCSFAFLRCYENGSPILELDKDEFISDYPTCRVKENRPGDMAEVYVTDKLRKFKFPEIKNERFMSEDVVWISMGIKYKTVYINKAIYQGEYLAGGLTANDKPSKFASPIGSMYRGVALMHKECGIKANIKGAIIYDCYKIAARQKYKNSAVTKIPGGNALTSLMSPFGIVFYYLWRKRMNNAHIKLRLSYSSLLYVLCIMIPIIQIINSAFLFSGGESFFGKVYRFILLLISAFIVIKTSKKQTSWIMLLLEANLIVVIYQVGCGVSLFDAILNMVKLLCPYVTAGAFIGLIDKGKIGVAYFDKMLRTLMIIVSLSIIIPRILGIGYERYEGSGYQGLYFENNALVVVLVVIFIYSLENLYRRRNLKNLFYVSLTTFSMVINGSKSSMALFAVITVLYILRYIFVCNPAKFLFRLIAIIISILGLGVMLYPVIYPLVEKRIAAYMYYYIGGVQVNGGTVLDFLTNGRTAFAESYFSKYYAKNSIMNVLFGIQRYGEIRVEMDPIDIFLYFGLLVSVLLIVYIVKSVRNLKYASFMVKLMFWSIMIYSFLAGHVWNSSLAGLPLSMMLAIAMSIKNLKVNSRDDELSVKYFA